VGWPNKERIEKHGMFYATNWDPAFIFVLMQIKPAKDVKPGDAPPVPDAIKPQNRIPAAKFFEELEKVAAAPVAPPATVTTTVTAAAAQTVTVTTVSTSTAVSTVVSTTTATTTVEVTNWAITVALAIVLLVVGFAIGWFLKKK
jgi:peptide/nickel transport system substrate-binding protein